MSSEHINNLIVLIFSDNKEDYKLGVNMIHAAEYDVHDLETIAKHCTNLLVNNINKQTEVYVLLCSMGKLLCDISDDTGKNANILKKWIGNYNSIVNQITPPYHFPMPKVPLSAYPSTGGTRIDSSSTFNDYLQDHIRKGYLH